MSESSKSKSDEYDPITYHHWQEFEIRRLKRSSEDFQQLFEDIMVRARPGFIRVRPYGNIGDRKCDGLFRDDSIFFQVYSPDELEQAKVQKKIDEDLDGAVAHWGDALKTWIFVYNVRRGVPPDILGTLQEKQKHYPDIKIDHLSNDALWEITRDLSVEQRNEILGLPPSSTAKIKQTPALLTNSQENEINWQEICRGMLPIELDANPLISGDGVTLGIEDIVPLDLVERKERPKPTREPLPDNFQQALADQEIPLPYNQFFDHVLIGCKSLNQQGKGVAIIGEPGAGKTTLLCAIADWIMKQGELPIFISLQDLEAGLEPYLLETWLRNAIRKRQAPEQLQDELIEQCNVGRVWLLLDGVDEMAQSNQSLSTLAKEFRGWIGDARIVLTCRVNIWEANKNELRSKFEIYRSRGFRDEEQLIFIQNFFKKAKQAETGSKLIDKLKNATPRLKDLIKNPLWITLLCRTWKQQQGELPATKAELYQRFTKTFYDWKDKPYIPEEKRPLLEQALGDLAKNAIDQEDFRFRLRETFIRQELDKFDSSLFGIACELGWINKLGSAVENPDEPVYAFLHPTFQEYFAAQSIPTFDFFLNHNNQEPNPFKQHNEKNCIYRIFEPHWREVILLWLGLPLEKIPEQQKENLIASLVTFNSGCGNTFTYRGLLLAVAGLGEFKNCKSTFTVMALLMRNCFCYLQEMEEPSRAALYETDQAAAIVLLSILALAGEDEYVRCESAYLLGKLNPGNEIAIQAFSKLIESTQYEWNIREYASKLLEINSDNKLAINTLIELCKTTKDKELKRFSKWALGKARYGNETVISFYIHSIRNDKGIDDLYESFNELEKVGQHQPRVINFLIELVSDIQDDEIHYDIIYAFSGIAPNNKFAIIRLEEIIQQSKDERVLLHTACCLNQITTNNSLVISTLNNLSHFAINNLHQIEAILTLLRIDSTNHTALDSLSKVIQKAQEESAIDYIFETIYEGLDSDIYVLASLIDPLIYLCETSVKENIKRIASSYLGEINPGNQVAVQTLLNLIQNFENEDIRVGAATDLGEIDPGNKIAIQTLLELIQQTESERIRMQAASSLGEIEPSNRTALKTLLELIKNTNDEDICAQAADLLAKIAPGNLVAIRTLTRLIISSEDESDSWKMIWNLGHIKSNLEAVISALVEIIQATNNGAVIRNAFERIKEIGHGNKVAIKLITKVITSSQDSNVVLRASECLIKILRYDQLPDILSYIQSSLSFKEHPEYKAKFVAWYPVIWHCTQNMSYPDFYRSWHISPSSDSKLLTE